MSSSSYINLTSKHDEITLKKSLYILFSNIPHSLNSRICLNQMWLQPFNIVLSQTFFYRISTITCSIGEYWKTPCSQFSIMFNCNKKSSPKSKKVWRNPQNEEFQITKFIYEHAQGTSRNRNSLTMLIVLCMKDLKL